jgi:MinD superfamily P-loop ATPase
VVVADCDVDAADMHLLLEPDFDKSEDFYSGELAVINQDKCNQCGECANVCRFDAITINDEKYLVNDLNCEGCGYCARVCPMDAITNVIINVGEFYVSKIKTGSTMVHAKLGIGADNSGKLVAKVKNEAKNIAISKNKDFVLIDGSPGIGCPVISSISGADFVVLVTEPTISGMHDLKRVYELIKKFKIRTGCIINKFDINNKVTIEIEKYLQTEGIINITKLPYNEAFTEAMTNGKTIVEYTDNVLQQKIADSWEKIQLITN